MFGRSTAGFDKLVEKATSNLLLEPDWPVVLQICDSIRQGDVQAKYAINTIKKKLYAPNPHVALYALQVLESCVKNCGSPVHQEIATKAFMEELRELLKVQTNDTVKNKVLELIQAWAHAFRNEPNYRAVSDALNLMKMEGYKFPALKESDAMFAADQAPDWADGDCCHRCRTQFTVINRKHHCRNCGQVFCSKCSSRTSILPRYGFEREVRVCEACWEKLSKQPAPGSQKPAGPGSEQTAGSTQPQSANKKSEQELQEEEELQLAIALSKSEAETKEKQRSSTLSQTSRLASSQNNDISNSVEGKKDVFNTVDPELAHYLNRSYWEQRQQNQQDDIQKRTSPEPSAPMSSLPVDSNSHSYSPTKLAEKYQNGIADEIEAFKSALQSQIEIFVNRMKSNSSRGRPIANDTAVQTMFLNISNMHSQLLKYLQELDDQRAKYEALQDKLGQIRDARAALDALREEHQERLRREAEEAERLRQIQMAQKLDIMRKKKQEYLQYQREIALQRMQEQEREMHLRQEQQKHHYQALLQGMQPGVYPPPPQTPYMQPSNSSAPAGFHPPPPPHPASTGSSPVHSSFQNPYGTIAQPGMPPPGSQQPFQHADYPAYNMQGMVGALPQVPQYPPGPQQVPTTGAVLPPANPLHDSVGGPIPAPHMMGGQAPPVMHPQAQPVTTAGPMGPVQQVPSQQVKQDAPQAPPEAELISFE